MFLPWFVFWAPQYHFPWSGSVAQQIEPNLTAFFNGISPQSGDKDIERQAFDVASYGKQLGWLTEVVLGQLGRGQVDADTVEDALKGLEDTQQQVEALKLRKLKADMDRIGVLLETMKKDRPKEYALLAKRLRDQG
jgi:hypothetical protein